LFSAHLTAYHSIPQQGSIEIKAGAADLAIMTFCCRLHVCGGRRDMLLCVCGCWQLS
jgi:hypothetical protein